MNKKQNIRLLSLEEIKDQTIQLGEKAFRAKQLWEWLWKRNALSFEQMDTLPKAFRESLAQNFDLLPIKVKTQQVSTDRTVKTAFNLHDGFTVEGVLIPTAKRMTACISTQVGCSLTCKFCATGKLKRERNIQFDEIFDQVAYIKNQADTLYKKPLTNIVYMGMGEPLYNFDGVKGAMKIVMDGDGLALSLAQQLVVMFLALATSTGAPPSVIGRPLTSVTVSVSPCALTVSPKPGTSGYSPS
mgnify:CR=1 FL=1